MGTQETSSREANVQESFPPVGWVDREGAILGITQRAMKHWVTDGKLTCGVKVRVES